MKKHIYVLLSVLLWGSSQFLMDRLNQVFSPALMIFLRFLLSGIIITLPIKRTRKTFQWKYFITGGLGAFGYYILTVYAMVLSSVSFVAIMGGSLPILAVLVDLVLVKQKSRRIQIIAAMISTLGIFLYSFDTDIRGNVFAAILMIMANLSWLIYCYLKKKWDIGDNIQILGYEFICAAVLTLPLGWTFHVIRPVNTLSIAQLFGVVIFATIIPYWLYLKGSIGLSLNTASMYMNLLPVASLLPVLTFSGFHLSNMQIAGVAVLILSAIIGK